MDATTRGPARPGTFWARPLAVGLAAAVALLGGCTGEGPVPDPTAAPSEPTSSDPPSTDPPAPAWVLADWVELPGGLWAIASDDAGRAAFSPGGAMEIDGDFYADLIAYDVPTGQQLWALENVRAEVMNASAESAGEVVVSVVHDGDGDLLVGTDWETGEPRWQVPVAELGICREFVISPLTDADVVALRSSAPDCADDSGPSVLTLDPLTGQVREPRLDLPGAAWVSEVGGEFWAVATDDTGLTAATFDPVTGDGETVSLPWSQETVSEVRGDPAAWYWIWPFDVDTAVIVVSTDEGMARVLMDWGSGTVSEFTGAPECFGDRQSLNDPDGRTCLADATFDGTEGISSFSFDGEQYWELPSGAYSGFSVDGDSRMAVFERPMEVSGWLVSTGDDLLTLVARPQDRPVWVVGEGEGSGAVGYGYLAGVDTLVALVEGGPDTTVILTVDASTGEELDRRVEDPMWFTSTDTAVVATNEERTLVRMVQVAER
ncbi:PQQ-like beta-propeller repeat protein [Occultella gossypii]|uniref:PQQ-like domain-containing protein n=1 Tax=Occultella gossypii TaxID=2800820 RepID=A0ABS7SBH1_9MICO|nr:PQQ-like beta-propeller repeat protein [Occultella gossypii]MBZ2197714.1 hypothetical protein [Occultella gossypii]